MELCYMSQGGGHLHSKWQTMKIRWQVLEKFAWAAANRMQQGGLIYELYDGTVI